MKKPTGTLFLFSLLLLLSFVADVSSAHKSKPTSKSVLRRTPRCSHDSDLEEDSWEVLTVPQEYPAESVSRTAARADDNNNTMEPIKATGPLRIRLDYRYLDNVYSDTASGSQHTCTVSGEVIMLSTGKSYNCREEDVPTSAKIAYVRELMAYAVEKIQSLLDVVQIEGNLTLARGQYNPFIEVGSDEDEEQANANFSETDLLVYVTGRPAGSDDVYATGRTIVQDDNMRPILGQINWNPSLVLPPGTSDDNQALVDGLYRGVAFHEMMHVLGFSSGVFIKYRDSNGRAWPQPVQKKTLDGREVTFLTTPRVREAVRLLHGCHPGAEGYDDLIGAAIEDQGGSGTAGSHWEKAAFMDEVMTGTASFVPVISNITLAALEDSGWYRPHYEQAEWLAWGEGKGCDFSTQRCNNGWPRSGGYFCDSNGQLGCTYDRKAVGGCQLAASAGSLDERYNYLGTGEMGVDELADYCPYTRFYSNTWCTKVLSDDTPNDYGETYDGTGRCFQSSVFSSITGLATQFNFKCYPVHCTSPTDLKVKIGRYWYACPNASTTISPKGYYGKLHCAPAAEICPRSTPLDDAFPTFASIDPPEEYPGNPVTIRGTHLSNVSRVEVGYECKIVNKTDAAITCVLSASQSMQTILGTAVDIVLESGDIALVVPDGFVPKVAWKQWAEKNAFLLFSLLLAVLCLFLTFGIIYVKVKDTRAKNKSRKEKRQRAKRMAIAKAEKEKEGGDEDQV